MKWYLDVLKKYAVFHGRARRKELWMFVLFNIIISYVLMFVLRAVGLYFLTSLYSLAVLLPSIGVEIRRLHDIGKSGWWLFIVLVPLVGWILLLVWFCKDSDPGENAYGPNPKEQEKTIY